MAESLRDSGPRREEARVADRLNQLRDRCFVGRERELGLLERCAESDGPAVTFLHGIGGMGKSALLAVLAERLRARSVRAVYLDARSIEPTPRGFREALGGELGLCALADSPGVSVLIIDHYELLRLLDAWLRQDFVPQLPARVRLILSGRHPPTAGWSAAP